MPSLGDVLPWERVGWHARVEGAQVRLSSREEGLCLDLPGWEGHRGNGLRHRVTTWGREGEQGLGTLLVKPQPAAPISSLSSRLDGPLPSGVHVEGDTLGFPPLTAEHSGVYVCHVRNDVSWREAQVTVEVLGKLGGHSSEQRVGLRGGVRFAPCGLRGNWAPAQAACLQQTLRRPRGSRWTWCRPPWWWWV